MEPIWIFVLGFLLGMLFDHALQGVGLCSKSRWG